MIHITIQQAYEVQAKLDKKVDINDILKIIEAANYVEIQHEALRNG